MAEGRQVPHLAWDLVERIGGYLPPNEISCNLRVLCKAAAAHFSAPNHKVVRLSQPLPRHTFQFKWEQGSGPHRALTYNTKQKLLCFVAAEGGLGILEAAVEVAGCSLTCGMMEAAAAAGHLHICEWLKGRRVPWGKAMAMAAAAGHLHVCVGLQQQGCDWTGALDAAAGGGLRELCEQLLASGCPLTVETVCAAAKGGHVDLMEWLLGQLLPDREHRPHILASVAEGCDLATLKRLHADPRLPGSSTYLSALPAAARSPTPDWRAKLNWLQGHERSADAVDGAASLPDAQERLPWLHRRGYRFTGHALRTVAVNGNTAALLFLLQHIGEVSLFPVNYRWGEAANEAAKFWRDTVAEAAQAGQLAVLQLLRAHNQPVEPAWKVIIAAVEGGHMAVMTWLVEALGVRVDVLQRVAVDAAASAGNVGLMAWLCERGCRLQEDTVLAAVKGGCEAMLDWLVGHDCQLPEDGAPYEAAALKCDVAMLRRLRRMGCPWDRPEGFKQPFSDWVAHGAPLPVLRWLVEEGCPVAFSSVSLQCALGRREGGDRDEVATWLREEQRKWVRELQRANRQRLQEQERREQGQGEQGQGEGQGTKT